MIVVSHHVRLGAPQFLTISPYGSQPFWGANLVVPPGTQGYSGEGSFTCTDPGLHILFRMSGGTYDGGQRLVWNAAWNTDVEKVCDLISGICWLGCVGRDDEPPPPPPPINYSALSTKARERPLAMRCGDAAAWAQSILADPAVGLTNSRIVNALTAETLNNYDDGHIMLEVFIAGQWVHFDILNDCTFMDAAGHRLSWRDVIANGVANCTVDQLAYSERDKGSGWSSSDANLALTYMQRLQGQAPAWKQRIYQIPGITNTTTGRIDCYIPTGMSDANARTLNWNILTQAAWVNAYYPVT
jgi:hypothetical protein